MELPRDPLAPTTRLSRLSRPLAIGVFAGLPAALGAVLTVNYLAQAAMPPVPVPPANPITEEKRVLGKILFWDEQLSTSNLVSCGSCHNPRNAGADPRPPARHPGDDLVPNTPDDILASPGIIASDADNDYARSAVFGLAPQITDRAANSNLNAAFAPNLFWDGRATSQFINPETGAVSIPVGGALESQAVAPLLNNVEMAHQGFTWTSMKARIAAVRPLDLATNIPADMAAALADEPTYGELFQRAFGDAAVTAERVAFAIATYQRTLISDQTPFDRFRAGEVGAITPQQQQGFQQFQQHSCAVCHNAQQDLFTDNSFRNIGLRPVAEDNGRQAVTGNINDRGRFKVPGLRNVGLKRSFMHNGQFATLADVIRFYARAPGAPVQFTDNRDPVMNQIVPLPPQDAALIQDFLQNALTDPRVAAGTFPFDAPALFVTRTALRPTTLAGGVAGSGGLTPSVIAEAPALVGATVRVGVANVLGGASARLGVSTQAPVAGRITPEFFVGPVNASGVGNGQGVATASIELAPGAFVPGQVLFTQWFIADPAATGGEAVSNIGQFPVFCGALGCPCDSLDFNQDGVFPDTDDVIDFFDAFAGGECPGCNDTDFNNDGVFPDNADLSKFIEVFAGGVC
jgi:cytochrome c peroxidase